MVVAIGELTIRIVVGPPIVWKYPQERYVRDDEIGHRLVANQTAYTHSELFTTNSRGIRAAEVDAQTLPSQRRVVALGDSQTLGDGLPLENTWPAQLEAALNTGKGGHEWQVLNAGLSGSAPWQHAILLRRLAEHYQLDVVLLALYVNDVTPRPTYVDAYVITNTPGRRIAYILKRSALFTALWRARHRVRQWLNPKTELDRELGILTGEPDPLIEQGWRDVEISLRQIRDFCRERGIFFRLLVLPRRDQVSGSVPDTAYNQRSIAIAKSLGLRPIDLLEPLQRAYASHGRKLFITWDGHNTAIANQVIAAQVAAELLADEPTP
jgi:lysophospholipase L1-like esterase